MSGQTSTKEAERLDERISDLEKTLYSVTKSDNGFEDRLYEHYPQFMKEDFKKGKCVLLNGLDYEKIGLTDAAYFLSKDPRYVTPAIEHEAPVVISEVKDPSTHLLNGIDLKNTNGKKMDIEDVNNKNEYCICRKNQSSAPDDVLIQCDNCNEWFHPFCLKVSRIEVALLNLHDATMKWYCRSCLSL